jgi:hypothetical protein
MENSNTVTVCDFDTPLSKIGRTSRLQKINFKIWWSIDHLNLTDINRIFYPTAPDYIFWWKSPLNVFQNGSYIGT